MRKDKQDDLLFELRNPTPTIQAFLAQEQVVGTLHPAAAGRLHRLLFIQSLHTQIKGLEDALAHERTEREILRVRLDADGSNAERVDFQFATISHLRAEIDKRRAQSDLDADTLVNLRRLLHAHEGANRAQAAQINGLMAEMEELANSKAQSHSTSSSASSSAMPPPHVRINGKRKF